MGEDSRSLVVRIVDEPWGLSRGDAHEMLVRTSIIDEDVVALNNEPREMIGHDILGPHLVFDLQIKLLE